MKKSINSLNPEIPELLRQAGRRNNTEFANEWTTHDKLLTLLHFSDIHGEESSLKRIIKYSRCKTIKDLYDDVLFTGDFVFSSFNYGNGIWNRNKNAHGFLSVVGNHDAVKRIKGQPFDWDNRATAEEQFNTYIGPYIKKWKGVEYPEGKTYWRKIYKEEKIMLIGLNCMLSGKDDTEQIQYLESWLQEALTENLGVVIAIHDASVKFKRIKCSFNSFSLADSLDAGEDLALEDSIGCKTSYQKAVEKYISNGLDFICYLCGHIHKGKICYNPDYPSQLFVAVPTASVHKGMRWGLSERKKGTESEDLFHFVTFDRYSQTIKIIRVGCHFNQFLESAKVLVLNYKTFEIITNY